MADSEFVGKKWLRYLNKTAHAKQTQRAINYRDEAVNDS